jgi:hypothetical protein
MKNRNPQVIIALVLLVGAAAFAAIARVPVTHQAPVSSRSGIECANFVEIKPQVPRENYSQDPVTIYDAPNGAPVDAVPPGATVTVAGTCEVAGALWLLVPDRRWVSDTDLPELTVPEFPQ